MRQAGIDPEETGLTLIEMVVAASLTLVLLLGALSMVDLMRQGYLRAERAADATHRARLSLETIARDLRLAGLNVDPDGASGRPDEAIEGAWGGAVAARGDLDGGDPAARDDPERWIAGTFPSSRTGNDEIFAYALRRETGSGGADLAFEADVASAVAVSKPGGGLVFPRDGLVETVRLQRVVGADGAPAGAGCALYRASVANNASLWGTGSAIVWQPVADGIGRLEFRYFDERGVEIPPVGGGDGAREERQRIAVIEVRVMALESRADPNWVDRADPDPSTAGFRKSEQRVAVFLRNARAHTRLDEAAAWFGVPAGGF